MHQRPLIVALLLAAVLSGCDLVGIGDARTAVDVTFQSEVVTGQQDARDFGARGGAGLIESEGTFVAPMGGYELEAHASTDGGNRYVIEIRGEQTSLGLAIYFYHNDEVAVRGLARGPAEVRVVHRIGDSETTVLEADVLVE